MIMLDKLRDRPPEVTFTDRKHPTEALFLDRSYEPLRIGIRVRRALGDQYDADARFLKETTHVSAPDRRRIGAAGV
jgi:hypothetical protein